MYRNCHFQFARFPLALCAAALIVTAWPAAAAACDTPVYRYAMYRWQPTPYEVYHFHSGEMDGKFKTLQEKLAAARDQDIAPANVEVFPVDLAEDAELKTIPRDVRQLWQKKDVQPPLTMIVNPMGSEVFSGELDESIVRPLIDAPLRKEIGERLTQGHAGVYVLLTGKDEQLNEAAEKALTKLLADVNSGKLALYRAPDAFNPLTPNFQAPKSEEAEAPADEDASDDGAEPPAKDAADDQGNAETPQEDETSEEGASAEKEDAAAAKDEKDQKIDEKPPHSITMLKLSRDEAKAKDPWLLRSLLAVENDLHEFADEPMVFVVYGRGRALPPYIGKGITYDNLVEVTDFITSACSCTVKEQNPGVDLLMAYDWEAAAAAVAEKFGSEEGNEESLTDLFPQLIVPGGSDEPKVAATDDGAAADDGGETAVDDPAADDAPGDGDAAAGAANGSTDSPAKAEDDGSATAAAAEPETSDDATEEGEEDESAGDEAENSLASVNAELPGRQIAEENKPAAGANLVATLGIGLGVAFLALLAATFFILKPQ